MDVEPNDSSNPSLLCCRACLGTDGQLFNIRDSKLAEVYYRVTGLPLYQDQLPQHICIFCRSLLIKSESFRRMCVQTQQGFMAQLFKGELNTDHASQMRFPLHRFFKLSTTAVEVIDIAPSATIKIEPNIDLVDIDSIMKIEFGHNEVNDTSSDVLNDVKELNKRTRATTKKQNEIDNEYDNDFNDYDSSSDESVIIPVKKERKTIADKKEKAGLKSNDSKKVKKVVRKKNKVNKSTQASNTFDFAAFESEHAVQIVTLSKEEQLEEHAARKKSRNFMESHFKCHDCGKGFDVEAAYNNHRARHSPSEGPHTCEICSLRFKYACRLQKHEAAHRLKFICKFGEGCNFVCRDRGHAKSHHAMHAGKTYVCQHCGKTFHKGTTYFTHVRLSHPTMNVACDQCGETFVSQMGLKLHKKKIHSKNNKPQNFNCPTCSVNFISLDALNRHTDTDIDHKELRPCEQCGENCASEKELQAHVGERHSTESRRCEECNMTFASPASYDIHHRRKHLDQRYSDAGRHSVRRKKYVERPRPKGQYVCEQCGRIKPNEALLRYHQRIHQGVKPYACTECPKAFTLKAALNYHLRSHTGEKPYQCPGCPRAFSSKANFNRHHRTVHLGLRGHFPCSICARVFTTKSDMQMHVNAVHRGLPWPKRNRRRAKNGKNTPESIE